MKYLLDNDASSLALRGHDRLNRRILSTPFEDVWIIAIAVEEMLRGSLAAINTERTKPRLDLAVVYGRLPELIRHLARFNILPYKDFSHIPGVRYEDWTR